MPVQDQRFADKVVFVTGGGTGFGRAFAHAFATEGASVVVGDIDEAAGDAVADELRAAGHKAAAFACDVADETQVEDAIARTTELFGGVDVLVNNAGKHLLTYNQPFSVLPRDEVRALFEVNVVGVVNCSVACRPSMALRGGGAVLNIASMAGHLASTPYGVSKLAVRGLTVAFATEFAGDGIRVNCVSPGLMDTENAMGELPEELVRDVIDNRQLIHRQGRMSDVVAAALFLCSADSGFVTGETLKVSGGFPLYL